MIRWHMGMSEAGVHFRYPTGYAFNRAKELCPGITAIHTADMEAILRTREEIDPEIVEGHRKLYA